VAAKKPTKQQVAQAKARAGGNNPIKVTDEGLKKLGKAALLAGITLAPTGRAASTVAKFVSRSKATKLASGEPKVKTRTFTQGSKAKITNTPPKKSPAGPNSPIKGTKVKVEYKTKALTPRQEATVTTGRIVRERGKKVGTYVKGAATGALVTNEVNKAKAKKKK
jgi:hypothetical protein